MPPRKRRRHSDVNDHVTANSYSPEPREDSDVTVVSVDGMELNLHTVVLKRRSGVMEAFLEGLSPTEKLHIAEPFKLL